MRQAVAAQKKRHLLPGLNSWRNRKTGYCLPRALSPRAAAYSTTRHVKAHSSAPPVFCHSSKAGQSIRAEPAGQVSGSLFLTPSPPEPTGSWPCRAPNTIAQTVAGTKAMSLTTARNRPACAIATTAWRFVSYPPARRYRHYANKRERNP